MNIEKQIDEILEPLKMKLNDVAPNIALETKIKVFISTFRNLAVTNIMFGLTNFYFAFVLSEGQVSIISLALALAGFSGYMLYRSKLYFVALRKLKALKAN